MHLNRVGSQITCSNSMLHTFILPPKLIDEDELTWVGWEKNERGKMGPRMANMKATLDPTVY